MSSKLEAAKDLAKRGLLVLPIYPPNEDLSGCSCPLGKECKSPGKHPYTPLVPRGVADATKDVNIISRWFKNVNPELNIGVSGGTDFLIVDFDSSDAYYSWIAENPWAEETLRAKSGSGDGFHVYVKLEEGTTVANYNHKYGEVRGVNQYVVVPPSRHISGGTYEWIDPQARIQVAKPEQLPTRVGIRGSARVDDIQFGNEPPDHRAVKRFLQTLPPFVVSYINDPASSEDRSESDWALVRELVKRQATDHTIWSIFMTTPLSETGKFAEKGSHGVGYLKATIARARAETQEELRTLTIKNGTVNLDLGIDEETKDALYNYAADDDGNAHAVLAMHKNKFVYTSGFGWMVWNGKHWQMEGAEARLERAIIDTFTTRDLLGTLLGDDNGKAIRRASKRSAANMNATKALVKSLVAGDVTAEMFDKQEFLLNVNNGVIDLKSGELHPHNPEYYFTYVLDTNYEPSAKSTLWENFLQEMFIPEDEAVPQEEIQEILEWVQKAVGYSITGSTREEVFFYIYGQTRSGKGTFSETLTRLLRKPLAYGTDFKSFTTESNDPQGYRLAPLRNARFVVASESGAYDWLNAEVVKRLTGGDEIQASLKYQNFFGFTPQWKFWLFSNFEPKGDPRDNALWHRAKALKLPNTFAGRENKKLKSLLSSPENLEGILAWAVEGAIKWNKHGLHTPKRIKLFTEESRRNVDYTAQWIEDYIVVGEEDDFVPTATIYESYRNWMESTGHKPKGASHLVRDLTTMGFKTGRKSVNGVQTRGIFGIKAASAHGIRDEFRFRIKNKENYG